MKILYVITKSEIGGAQVHVRSLMKSMLGDGHQVALMSYPLGWLEDEANSMGVKFYPNSNLSNSFNPLRAIKAVSNIKRAVKDFSPDLVSLHSSGAGFLGRLAVRKKIPTIFTAHSWAFTEGAPIFRKIIAIMAEKMVAKYTNKVICVSEYDRELAVRYKIAPKDILVTIHNGVESVSESNTIRENIIVANGRLAYPKDYTLLLSAYSKANLPNMRLEIIGDGPDRGSLESNIDSMGLKGKVALLGNLPQNAVREKLLQSKIFILISKHEGFPLTILEAMSAGLPVVSSNVGGIAEQIDSTCGILVPNQEENIANAIIALSDENKQQELGEAARKKFQEKFTLDKFLEATKKVYKEMLTS